MKTLSLMDPDRVFTNLKMLLSDQCVYTIKATVFEGYNQTRSTFDKLRHIDQRAFPEIAIREALLNLLIHNIGNILSVKNLSAVAMAWYKSHLPPLSNPSI